MAKKEAPKEISFEEVETPVNWDELEPIRIKRENPPRFACVEVEAITQGHRSTPDGTKHVGRFIETRYLPVASYDDITHIDHVRKNKGWAVVAHHNILTDEKFQDKKLRQPKEEAFRLVKELDALALPPEMKRAARNVG